MAKVNHIERHYGVTKIIVTGATLQDQAVRLAAESVKCSAEWMRVNACQSTRYENGRRIDVFCY
jgi:hypothetical protein